MLKIVRFKYKKSSFLVIREVLKVKRCLLITLMLLLLVSLANAADFDVSVDSVIDSVKVGESAKFTITLDNPTDKIKNIEIYSDNIINFRLNDQTVKVYPNSEAKIELEVIPTAQASPGERNALILKFKDKQTNELLKEQVSVFVETGGKMVGSYAMAIDVDASVPSKIDPRDQVLMTVVVDNLNPLDLPDLEMKMTSDFEMFNTEQDIAVTPLGKKAVDFTYDLDPLQAPGKYEVNIDILRDGKVVEGLPAKEVEIIQINPEYKEEIKKESGFLKDVITITYTSHSNVKDNQKVKIPITTVKSWFTKVNPDTRIVSDEGEKYYLWNVELEPGESETIVMVRSYRIIFYILLVLAAIAFAYQYYSSPIKIRKSVTDVQMKEGGISEMKVMLEVRSLAKKTIKNVTISDYVPNIAEIDKHFVEGTLKPSKILKHKSKGTVLKWELDEIVPGEDRLISYTIKSSLSIMGNFNLPRAKVEFKHKKRKFYAYSNTSGVST